MHSAVLQNDSYIEFASDNTVEVMAMQRLKEGVDKGDRKAEQYDAEDENGQPVKYMVEFPGLTLEEMYALNSSKAGTYNDTGGIPYTAIIDPHTEEKMSGMAGGQSAKKMIEIITQRKADLNKKYGPSLSRSVLADVQENQAECDALLAEKGAGKAIVLFNKGYKKLAKNGEKIVTMLDAYKATLLEKAGEELESADELIEALEFSDAKKILSSLKSALKKTELAPRVDELYAKIKTKQAEEKAAAGE